MKPLIFLLEDDEDIAFVVEQALRSEGFSVKRFSKAFDTLKAFEEETPDLILIDVMLPDLDGFRVARFIKNRPDLSSTAVVFMSARTSEEDKLTGFELGADDYVGKPFSLKELTARVKAVLRRTGKLREEGVFRVGDLEVDTGRVKVKVKGKEVKLTPSEFEILTLLLKNYGKPLPRGTIIEAIGGDATDRVVDVHIKHLRDKLGECGRYIRTVRGFGYKLEL